MSVQRSSWGMRKRGAGQAGALMELPAQAAAGVNRRRWSLPNVLAAPRIVLLLVPWVGVAVGVKLMQELLDVSLLSGVVGVNVLLWGLLLAGTLADYKESERLPGRAGGRDRWSAAWRERARARSS